MNKNFLTALLSFIPKTTTSPIAKSTSEDKVSKIFIDQILNVPATSSKSYGIDTEKELNLLKIHLSENLRIDYPSEEEGKRRLDEALSKQ